MSVPKNRSGVVYSTNPDFNYNDNSLSEPDTLAPKEQKLIIKLDKKQRGGKTVTLISGFVGKTGDIEILSKLLKNKCGVGGSVKDREIIIQGELVEKVKEILKAQGYGVK